MQVQSRLGYCQIRVATYIPFQEIKNGSRVQRSFCASDLIADLLKVRFCTPYSGRLYPPFLSKRETISTAHRGHGTDTRALTAICSANNLIHLGLDKDTRAVIG